MRSEPDNGLRVGIATLWDGGLRFRCALPLWCQSVQRLADVVNAPIAQLIISPVSTWDGCGDATAIWSEQLAAAIERYHRLAAGGLQLMKFILFSLEAFDIVFFTDVECVPTPCAPVVLDPRH